MKAKRIVIIFLLIIGVIALYNYSIYQLYTKNILKNAGDLSRVAYITDYFDYKRNNKVDKNNFKIIKNICELDKQYDVMTLGDSYMNGRNELTYIQNYIDSNYSVVHLEIAPNLYNLKKLVENECFIKNKPKIFILERIERGLQTTFYSLKNTNVKDSDSYFNKGLKRNFKLEFFNSGNIKFLLINIFNQIGDGGDLLTKLVPTFYSNNTERKKLREEFFSIHQDILFFSKASYASIDWGDEIIQNITNNILSINSIMKANDVKFILMFMPEKLTVYGKYLQKPILNNFYENLYKHMAKQEINLINLNREFQKYMHNTLDIYQPDDTHLSRNGAKLVGKIINENLLKTISN